MEEQPERIRDDAFYWKKRFVVDRMLKFAVLLVLLVWGSVLLLKMVTPLKEDHKRHQLPSNTTVDGKLLINFDNIRNGTFKPTRHNLQWIKSTKKGSDDDMGLYATKIDDKFVIKSVLDEDYEDVLLKEKTFEYDGKNYTADDIIASPDLSKLLVRSSTVKNWRHSNFGTYFLYDAKKAEFDQLAENVALAVWSPNSVDVAYVQNNDIYVYSTKTDETIIVTDDGNENVFNGIPDWVYEEEVFSNDRALWWSPNGDYLAFLKTDETNVGEFSIPYYAQKEDDVYPEVKTIKYPKSGTPNPVVDLWVHRFNDDSTYPLNVSSHHESDSTLITEVTWISESSLVTKFSDRSSDVRLVLHFNADTKHAKVARKEPADDGWWEITHNTLRIAKDENMGIIEDGYVDVANIDGYNHLVYFSPADSKYPQVLTSGEWEVIDGTLAFNSKTGNLFFIGTREGKSTERHLLYVNINKPKEVHQVTDDSKRGVYTASFSSKTRFALLSYDGPDVPYQKIIELDTDKRDEHIHGNSIGKTLYYLEENKKIRDNLKDYARPRKTYQELNLGKDKDGNNIIVNSYEILPVNFDSKLKNEYPVFFFAYGGPNSQQCIERFSIGLDEVIATELNAIVVVVDGRGTGLKGRPFRAVVRDNLGNYEAEDQIRAAKLYKSKPFVNSDKVSLWGWSYGGYLTLKTLEKDAGENFKFGISVAPVTDWKLYDSVYIERYMHTPQENPEGYEKSKVSDVEALGKARRFLIMHGTGDDNVHFQHTLKLLDRLNLKAIENYDVHVFPDSDHAIKYHNANDMIYNRIVSWTRKAFNGEFDPK